MTNPITPSEALARAVKIAGGQAPFARVVGVTQGAVWQRLKANKPAAAGWVLKAQEATGISKHDLRPDIYPVESASTEKDNTHTVPDKMEAAR